MTFKNKQNTEYLLMIQNYLANLSRANDQRRGRPLAAECGTLREREMLRQISSRIRHLRNSRDLLHALKSATWDRRSYFSSEGRRAEDIFAFKIHTASAGFEPANLGTKGQQATSTKPKQLFQYTIPNCNIPYIFYLIL
jgi:hypothetical protein